MLRGAALGLVPALLSVAMAGPMLAQVETPTPSADVAAMGAMPPVSGVEWLLIDEQTGAQIAAEGSPSAVAAWREILEALGADFDDLRIDVHLAALEGTDLDYGVVLTARIESADAAGLRSAFEQSVPQAMPPDAVITATRLAGKDVLLVQVPPDYRFIYHYAGDAAYQLDLAPEIEQLVLEALP